MTTEALSAEEIVIAGFYQPGIGPELSARLDERQMEEAFRLATNGDLRLLWHEVPGTRRMVQPELPLDLAR